MIGLCSKCGKSFETTEEDANTPGIMCPGCHKVSPLAHAFNDMLSALLDVKTSAIPGAGCMLIPASTFSNVVKTLEQVCRTVESET